MGKKRQLERKIKEARKDKRKADQAIKEYVDFRENGERIPKPLRSGYLALRKFKRGRVVAIKRWRAKKRKLKRNPRAEQMKYLRENIGVTENPPGSNDGTPNPRGWLSYFHIGPAPWCGALAGYAAIEKGQTIHANPSRWLYVPYIVTDARNDTNGFHEVPIQSAEPGDAVCFNFDGGVADHVGTFVSYDPATNTVKTIDGNTSSGSSGSQDNGGGVFERTRPTSMVECIARPER